MDKILIYIYILGIMIIISSGIFIYIIIKANTIIGAGITSIGIPVPVPVPTKKVYIAPILTPLNAEVVTTNIYNELRKSTPTTPPAKIFLISEE